MLICVILSLTQWKFEKGKIHVELSRQEKFHCLGKAVTLMKLRKAESMAESAANWQERFCFISDKLS